MPQINQNQFNQYESENLAVGWPWRLLSASFLLFLVSILTYFGLIVGYLPYLEKQIQEIDIEIGSLASSISKEDQQKFISFYSQLNNIKSLLDVHVLTSNVFPKLESVTNSQVYFTGATLKTDNHSLELSGVAEDYGVLGEQLEAFNQSPEISRYILTQSQIEDEIVRFHVTLVLDQELLK
ncbi:hypothetical protein GW950_01705 [Candidatus Wolfebacteria bacterium]|nr:hypothetical protein [Candidatus Wolfebacteria bacterium]